MNTPVHVILNMVILSPAGANRTNAYSITGSLLPDLPMFIFYFFERFIRGVPERTIWSQSYYFPGWQNFIDLFNSVPLIILGGAVAWYFKARSFVFFCITMMPTDIFFHFQTGDSKVHCHIGTQTIMET
ncbi:MAG: hypothetical protein ACI9XC_002584 [Gammaproteobacteria bacterium]|jgi:hypothetical protein